MSDVAFASALEQARLVRDKEASPIELVELYLARIDKLDPEVNAYVTVVGEQALAQARKAEQDIARGEDIPPFHGVPISLKDLSESAGIRTTLSTKSLEGFVPDQDDAVVKRIRAAGFIILGKTNTSEFGTVPFAESELNGYCRNPWDPTRTPGGSSGGAAAGVAAGLAPIAQAADGGGSVRVPASCCGLFGIKPSRGRVSAGPRMAEYWHGYSTAGPIGRTVEDAAALLDVMSGYEWGDPYMAPTPERPFATEARREPGRLRIGFTASTPNEIDVDPICIAAMNDAAELLSSLGHVVEEAGPQWVDQAMQPSFIQLVATGTAILSFLPVDQMEPHNRFLVGSAQQLSSVQHMQALASMNDWTRRVVSWWADHDVLLTPTVALPPTPVGWVFEDPDPMSILIRSGLFIPFTPPANVTGQPAVSLPLYWDDAGMPIGVQLMGKPAGEAELIRLSAQLEEARPWAGRRPAIS